VSAKDVLAGKSRKKHGSGTPVSGYVDTPERKACATCEYLVKGHLCKQKVVQTDKKVKTDPVSGLKIVSPENGCCSYWEPN
jgi:hypothetical protein